ncbi:MAG: hypothetical protein LM558_00220 [Thermosphaera sp.]|nr:hypothetical protein [Thermosphaera sp.]
MPATYILKKILKTNTTYTMEKDRYYVIKKIGTDAASKVTVKVDGIPVVDIFSTIAPIAKTSSNTLGPMDLEEYFIVVPPERQLLFESSATANVYIEGDLVVLIPGETVATEHLTRYNTYASRKITYVDASVTVGTSWAAGQEVKIVDITPSTIEDWLFDGFAGVAVSNLSTTLTYGQVNVKLYFDGKPFDLLLTQAGPYGIESLKMPLPPTDSAEKEGFNFKEKPIMVTGGHTLTVTAVNVSGSTLSAATGQNIAVRFVAVYKRIIKG